MVYRVKLLTIGSRDHFRLFEYALCHPWHLAAPFLPALHWNGYEVVSNSSIDRQRGQAVLNAPLLAGQCHPISPWGLCRSCEEDSADH